MGNICASVASTRVGSHAALKRNSKSYSASRQTRQSVTMIQNIAAGSGRKSTLTTLAKDRQPMTLHTPVRSSNTAAAQPVVVCAYESLAVNPLACPSRSVVANNPTTPSLVSGDHITSRGSTPHNLCNHFDSNPLRVAEPSSSSQQHILTASNSVDGSVELDSFGPQAAPQLPCLELPAIAPVSVQEGHVPAVVKIPKRWKSRNTF